MSLKFAGLCLFFAGASLAHAQGEPQSTETLVVTGTRVPGPRAIGPTTVIDAQAIEIRNDASVMDLLRDVPGLHVSAPGGRGSVGEVFLRGGEANFTSVLIDGVQVNDPTNTRGGSFDFSTLNIDDVARVEIVPGPLSSIYGSDALSGVINIITRGGGEQFRATAGAELGGSNYLRGAIGATGPVGDSGGFAVRIGALNDGDSADSQMLRSRSFTGKFESQAGSSGSFSAYARYGSANTRAFPDASGGPLLSVLRLQDKRETTDSTLGLAYVSSLNDVTELHIRTTFFEHSEDFVSQGVAAGVRDGIPPNQSDSEFFRATANLFLASGWTDKVETAFGLNYQRDTGESASLVTFSPQFQLPTRYEVSRDNVAAYAELAYAADNGFGLLASVRADDTELAGRESTARFSAHYAFANGHARLRAGWGQAFKLPSLFALSDPLVGNPELRPETAESSELGLDSTWLNGRAGVQITIFEQNFEDLIDFDFELFTTVNRSQVETDGVELSGHYELAERWRFAAHITRTDIDVIGAATQLTGRPEKRGGFELRWVLSDALEARAAWLYVGERFESSIPTGDQLLDAYDRVDLAISWRPSGAMLWRFAIDNIFDEKYQDAIGFPDFGRRARISVRAEFGSN